MDLKALGYFVAAVETGSITAAANRCFIAQPSITAAIQRLEEEFSLQLLVRQQRGVIVTAQGKEFYNKAKSLLLHAQTISQQFKEQRDKINLSIYVSHAISFDYLNQLIKLIHKHNSHVKIEIIRQTTPLAIHSSYNSSDNSSDNNSDRKTLGIRLTSEQALNDNEEFIPLWHDQYSLVIPLNHALAYEKNINLAMLSDVSFIGRSFCESSQVLERFLTQQQITLDYVAQVDNEEWALSLVESGLGLCIMPMPESIPSIHANSAQNQQHADANIVQDLRQIKIVPLSNIDGLQSFERRVGVAIDVQSYSEAFYGELAASLKANLHVD